MCLTNFASTKYAPGEIRVVAYDCQGSPAMEKSVKTSGKAKALVLTANRDSVSADDNVLVYFTVRAVDAEGNFVPVDERMFDIRVTGSGTFEATANGGPTCLLPFQEPRMKLFSGAATAIARASATPGSMKVRVSARGLRAAEIMVKVR